MNVEFTQEELATEIWRPVNLKGYSEFYQVSNIGRVKSIDRTITYPSGRKRHSKGKLLSPFDMNGNGYKGVGLANATDNIKMYVHRLVALSFIKNPDPKNKTFVNHLDENSLNNRETNLDWVTPYENSIWGTLPQRRSKPVAAIDLETNQVIKTFDSVRQASELFECSPGTISRACTGKRKTSYGYKWKHI